MSAGDLVELANLIADSEYECGKLRMENTRLRIALAALASTSRKHLPGYDENPLILKIDALLMED